MLKTIFTYCLLFLFFSCGHADNKRIQPPKNQANQLVQPAASPTIVTKIVDPDNGPGTDYTSLEQFDRGENRDLVAANEIAVAICRSSNGSPDKPAQFNDWVTDSLHYVKVVAAKGHRASARWDDRKYRIIEHTKINSECIDVEVDYMEIDGIQMLLTGTGRNNDVIDPSPCAGKLTVKNCFIWLDIDTTSGTGLDPACDVEIYNNIFKSMGGGQTAISLKIRDYSNAPFANVYNNTFIGWNRAIRAEYPCRAVNNLVVGVRTSEVFITKDDGKFTPDSDYNSSNIPDKALVNPPRNATLFPWNNSNLSIDKIFMNPAKNDFRLRRNSPFGNIGIGPALNHRVPKNGISGKKREGGKTTLGADVR